MTETSQTGGAPQSRQDAIEAMQDLTPEQQLNKMGYKQELNRSLTFMDLLIYGLIFMVPIAPWTIFGTVYNLSNGMVPLVYLIGMVAMVFTALSYSQMAKAIPMAGSVYNYVGKGLHPTLGFFAGWLMLLDYLLVPTLLYVMAAVSMAGIFPGTPQWMWALIFVAINVIINIRGVSSLKWMNRIFLIMELVFLVVLIYIFGSAIVTGSVPGAAWSIQPIWDPEVMTPAMLAAALSVAVLSFLGFDGISTLAEETKGGRSTAGRAMIVALVIVGVLFIIQTWLACMVSGPFSEIVGDDAVNTAFFDAIRKASSSGVVTAFYICNVLAVGIANAMAAQAATSRLLYSMARDRQLPHFLCSINKRKVPGNAILLVGVISAVLVLFFVGQLNTLSSMVNFGALSGFILLHISVIYFYTVKEKSRSFFLHLISPLIGFVIITYVLINAGTPAHIAGGIWIFVGLCMFLYYRKKGISIEMADEPDETDIE